MTVTGKSDVGGVMITVYKGNQSNPKAVLSVKRLQAVMENGPLRRLEVQVKFPQEKHLQLNLVQVGNKIM